MDIERNELSRNKLDRFKKEAWKVRREKDGSCRDKMGNKT